MQNDPLESADLLQKKPNFNFSTHPLILAALVIVGVVLITSVVDIKNSQPVEAAKVSTKRVAINDLGTGKYLNAFQGGLYENGTNVVPADHASAGMAKAKEVQPLDADGNPSPTGKMVLMSIGFSNATMEWCVKQTLATTSTVCTPQSFMYKAANDSSVNHSSLVIANGAMGGQTANDWDDVADPNYDRVRDTVLAPMGLTEKQVEVLWVKIAHISPTLSLPNTQADAYTLETDAGEMMRALKTRYPNLKQVYIGSRIYGGYATTNLNPEPYAYEGGFAVKWLIQAQVNQMRTGAIDPKAGDLNYTNGTAPWIAWGPYLWADGTNARSDGLTWVKTDFMTSDYTHPSAAGINKVSTQLGSFFKTSPFTSCWFLEGQVCQ